MRHFLEIFKALQCEMATTTNYDSTEAIKKLLPPPAVEH